MLLRKFLDTIKSLFPEKHLKISVKDLAHLDPDRITVESVRAVLNTSHNRAVDVCETAVGQGYFQKRIAVYRPDGSIACVVDNEHEIPRTIPYHEEIAGHYEEEEIDTDGLKKRNIYALAI